MSEPESVSEVEQLSARVVELEIRSEEQIAAVTRVEEFVTAYEERIAFLERQLRRMQEEASGSAEATPSPEEDLPPHY